MDNVIFRMAKVESVDWEAKELVTSVGRLPYDILVLATGSTTNFFGNRDMAAKAMQLKTVGQALDIRSDLQNFERAVALSDTNQTDEQRRCSHFVIVGGGPTGVEVAGALAEIKNKILTSEYREVDPQQMDITVIDAGPRLLFGMSEESSARAKQYLEKLGVGILLDTQVQGYDGETVRLSNGQEIETETVIWAAGVKGNPIPGLRKKPISPTVVYWSMNTIPFKGTNTSLPLEIWRKWSLKPIPKATP